MEETIESLKKQVSVLEQKLALYEKDAAMRGYYILNRILNTQVDYLQTFQLNQKITADPKEDKVYERAKGLWEGMKTLIFDLEEIRLRLKATGEEEIDIRRSSFTDRLAEKRL